MSVYRCYLLRILMLLFAVALAGCSSSGSKPSDKRLATRIATTDRLYTTEYRIHKIVAFSDDVRLKGKMFSDPFDVKVSVGDRKILVPIDVTLKAYIDFSAFDKKNIERTGDSTITIVLPDPRIIVAASSVDHKGIRSYVDMLRSGFDRAEIDKIAKQGLDSIINHADEYGIIEAARASAAEFIIPLAIGMGYDEADVKVVFRSDLMAGGMASLFDVEQIKSIGNVRKD